VKAGRVREGLALLDESMVVVTTQELWPFTVGIVYCGVILACSDAFEVARARQWTEALTEWKERQPELVAFTGRCLVHRAEILQLGGSWEDALEEARLAGRRFVETRSPAAGVAHYRQAELLRLKGEFGAAEEAYREASRFGWEPQPGLAQLRLAQGKIEAARAASIFLAPQYESAMLDAIVAHAEGAVALAEGDAPAALARLRHAQHIWLSLDAPYEVARTRELIGKACAVLGDDEAGRLELEAARELFERLGAAPDLSRVATRSRARYGLSERELEVLRLVASGKSNREVASTLVISEHTVARHLQNIYAKLSVSSRAAATAFAFAHELV